MINQDKTIRELSGGQCPEIFADIVVCGEAIDKLDHFLLEMGEYKIRCVTLDHHILQRPGQTIAVCHCCGAVIDITDDHELQGNLDIRNPSEWN